MQPSPSDRGSHRPTVKRRRLGRFVPLVIFALVGLFMLKEQVPAVNHWFQRITAPESFAAGQACRRAALNAADDPGYARLRSDGEVHETRDGFYVEGVEVGSQGEHGAETVFRYSCYVDRQGNLVSAGRTDVTPEP